MDAVLNNITVNFFEKGRYGFGEILTINDLIDKIKSDQEASFLHLDDKWEVNHENESTFLGTSLYRLWNEALYPILDANSDGKWNKDIIEDKLFLGLEDFLKTFLEQLNQYSGISTRFKYPINIYSKIKNSYIVLTSKHTDRIRQQQGAFIYPCFANTDEAYSLDEIKRRVHDSIMKKSAMLNYQNEKYTHIIIPEDKKADIQKELALIGIDEGFIYPDIKHRSNALLK